MNLSGTHGQEQQQQMLSGDHHLNLALNNMPSEPQDLTSEQLLENATVGERSTESDGPSRPVKVRLNETHKLDQTVHRPIP